MHKLLQALVLVPMCLVTALSTAQEGNESSKDRELDRFMEEQTRLRILRAYSSVLVGYPAETIEKAKNQKPSGYRWSPLSEMVRNTEIRKRIFKNKSPIAAENLEPETAKVIHGRLRTIQKEVVRQIEVKVWTLKVKGEPPPPKLLTDPVELYEAAVQAFEE